MTPAPIAAAVLAGGQSRRMGTPKATIRLRPDGPTMIETVVRTLGNLTDDIVLVGTDAGDLAEPGLPWVADTLPDAGPLAGIHAALAASSRDHVLVVACDMPFLSVDLLRYMAHLPRAYDVLVPVVGQAQPLHAIYARTCLPIIEEYLNSGHRRVDGWFGRAIVQTIDEATVRHYDSGLRSCFNMNTPDDLERARRDHS